MVRVSVSLALLVLAAAASSAAATPGAALRGLKAQSSGGCTSSTPGMDYTLLVQQWPATESRSAEENFFTLHGNWPTYNDGSYPCECGGSFDPNEISSISSDMNKFWPSFRGSNDDFWSHEWTKHGTCASSSPYLKGELNFFSNTLKARASFDIYDALTKGGLQTGTRVSLSDVHSALRQAFGHDGVVGCTGGALDSISLCLTPDLDATDCPSNQSDSGCSSSIEWSAPSRR